MKHAGYVFVRVLTLIYVAFSIFSCRLKSDAPSLSEGQTVFEAPVTRPFTLPEAKPINWKIHPADSVPVGQPVKFDLRKLSSKPFSLNAFKAMKKPADTRRLDWDKIEKIPLRMDTVTGQALKVRKFLLPKPLVSAASGPGLIGKGTSGLLRLGQAEGLPGNSVFAMTTDPDGSVWISTEKGLSKYTGEEFVTYNFFLKEESGSVETLSDLLIDAKGRLLVSANRSGIYRIDITLGIVEYFELGFGPYRMSLDNKGRLWGGKDSRKGLFFIDLEKKQVFRVPLQPADEAMNEVYGAWCDPEGNVWIGLNRGVGVIDSSLTSLRLMGETEGLPVRIAYGFSADTAGNVWITAFSKGAYAVSLRNKTITGLGPDQGFNGVTNDVFTDAKNRLWLMSNDTVSIYDFRASRMKKIVTNVTLRTAGYPTSGMKGEDGLLWMGSEANGAIIINPNGMLAEHFSEDNGLESNDVWGIQEDSKGRMWLATYNGIQIYDPFTEKISLLKFPAEISRNENRQIRQIRKDVFFLGSYGGFGIIDLQANIMTFYNTLDTKVGQTIFCGIGTEDGNIWFSGGDGLMVFDPVKKSFKKLDAKNGLSSSLAFITQQDRQGRIWVITENGANIIDPKANTVINLYEKDGLLSNYTSTFFQTGSGDIYIGSDKGLNVFDKDLKTITTVSEKNGLIPPAMYDMTEVNGRINIGSENGIIVVEKPQEKGRSWKFYTYSKSSGFPYNDYNQATAFPSSSGSVWWGAAPVMTVTHQDAVADTLPPKVMIRGMNIMDQNPSFRNPALLDKELSNGDTLWAGTTPWLKGRLPADSGYLVQNKIRWDSVRTGFQIPVGLRLPYHQNSFNFSFVNPGVLAKERTVYRYLLEGKDTEWSEIGPKTVSRIYYNIEPGKYSFKVITRGFNGVWSEPDVLSFTILPPWWQTWWAYTLFALLAGVAVYLIVKVRSRWLEEENRLLEEKVEDRTAALNQKMEELRSAQNQLIQSEKMASLGELTAGIAHEIQNPLNFVNNFSEVSNELIDEIEEESSKPVEARDQAAISELLRDVKENLGKIIHHGKRADSIVKGMLQHSRSSNGTREPVNLNLLVDEYLRLAYHGLRAKDKSFNATLKTDYDKSITMVSIVGQDIGRVVLNLITNAFYAVTEKPSREDFEPVVSVSTKKINDLVEISVSDNGIGIPAHIKDKIFQPFFTTKPTGQGTGLGLSLAYDIVKAHGGELQVETREGEGTTFTICIPTNN